MKINAELMLGFVVASTLLLSVIAAGFFLGLVIAGNLKAALGIAYFAILAVCSGLSLKIIWQCDCQAAGVNDEGV